MSDTNKQVSPNQNSLLDELLEGKSADFRSKVLHIVAKYQMTQNDPLFLLLVATGQLAVLLDEIPEAIEYHFADSVRELQRALDLAEKLVVERQKTAIANAAKDLIRQTELQQARRLFDSILPATGVLLAVLGLGGFAGMTIPPFLQGGYAEEVKLTKEQVDALTWAMSDEGKLARNLVEWNRGYLETCAADAKNLGVKMKFGGRAASSGFCFLWTSPPKERGFVEQP